MKIQQGLNGKDKSGTNEYRKIHPRNYRMHKNTRVSVPSSEFAPPTPPPQASVSPPRGPKWWGRHTSLRGKGMRSQFRRLDRNSDTLVHYNPFFEKSSLVTVSGCLYKYSGSSLTINAFYICHGEKLFETKWRQLCTARFFLGAVLLVHGKVDEADRTHPPRLAVLPGQQPSHQPFHNGTCFVMSLGSVGYCSDAYTVCRNTVFCK